MASASGAWPAPGRSASPPARAFHSTAISNVTLLTLTPIPILHLALPRHRRARPARSSLLLPLLLCALGFAAAAAPAQGQEFGRTSDIQTSGTSYHVFARPGEATVQVQVIGAIAAPGLYEVGSGTDLGRLIALAGGPPLASPNPNVEREATVRLYRQEEGMRSVVYEASYEEMLEEPQGYPSLQDEDVLTIEAIERQNFTWRNALNVVGSVGGILLLADRIFGIFGGN